MKKICVFIFLLAVLSTGGCSGHRKPPARKVLLVCIDGATWNILEPLLKGGVLPNFSRLVNEGSAGPLFSPTAFSPPSWTSIATGKSAEKHGVDLFHASRKRKARYVWDILGDFDIHAAVVDWLMAYPKKTGVRMYRPATFLGGVDKFSPKDSEMTARRKAPVVVPPGLDDGEIYRFYDVVDKNIMNVAMFFVRENHPGLLAIGFEGSNPYQHRYWSAAEPKYFDISREEISEKRDLISAYYRKIDRFLDYFIKNDYTIVVVSDHGFCRNDSRSGPRIIAYLHLDSDMQHVNFLANRWLEAAGFLVFQPKLEGGAQIDFSKTRAYFVNANELGLQGIAINRSIVKESDVAGVKEQIACLMRETHFETGEPFFIDVEGNAALLTYSAPDIVFKLNSIFRKENMVFEETDDSFDLSFEYLKGKDQSKIMKIVFGNKEYALRDFINYSRDGVHENSGIIILWGENVKKRHLIKGATLYDITPLLLDLFGLPMAKDMDGVLLSDALEPKFLREHPVRYVPTYEASSTARHEESSSGPDHISAKRLHSLGYVQ